MWIKTGASSYTKSPRILEQCLCHYICIYIHIYIHTHTRCGSRRVHQAIRNLRGFWNNVFVTFCCDAPGIEPATYGTEKHRDRHVPVRFWGMIGYRTRNLRRVDSEIKRTEYICVYTHTSHTYIHTYIHTYPFPKKKIIYAHTLPQSGQRR